MVISAPGMTKIGVIGVDVGGTKIAGALGDAAGRILARRTLPTWPGNDGQGRPGGLDTLLAVIGQLRDDAAARGLTVGAVGVGVPGIMRHREGVVVLAPNLFWRDYPLGRILGERLGLPVALDNDTNLAALGEARNGAGRGVESFFGLFIGTGVGAGVVIHDRLWHGAHEAAGEIGYALMDPDDLAHTYPDFGALELIIAGPGIAARAVAALVTSALPSSLRETGTAPDAAAVFRAARAGDALATATMSSVLDALARALAAVTMTLDPHRIVLGGSVGLALAPWYDAILARLADRIPLVPTLVPAALGDDAPLHGALALAREQLARADGATELP